MNLVAQRFRISKLVHFAILTTAPLYGVVLFLVPLTPQEGSQMLLPLLGLVAFALIPMILVCRKAVMGSLALGGADEGPPAEVQPLSDPELEAELLKATARYQTGTIIGSAVGEAVALLGFVGAFLSGNAAYALPFLAGGTVLIAAQIPREICRDSLLPPAVRAAWRRRSR